MPFPVVTFEQPEGLSFYGQPCWEPRTNPSGAGLNLVVLHWDECVSSHDCFHVLLERKLSAHLLLDDDGTVYQTLDLAEARAWHARQANDRSVGIEINNPVHPGAQLDRGNRRAIVAEPRPHSPEEWLHLDFLPVQKERLAALVPALCEHLKIPARLPLDAHSEVERNLMQPGFTGVCGHFHLQTDKVDPGHTAWPVLKPLWHPAEAPVTEAAPAPAAPQA